MKLIILLIALTFSISGISGTTPELLFTCSGDLDLTVVVYPPGEEDGTTILKYKATVGYQDVHSTTESFWALSVDASDDLQNFMGVFELGERVLHISSIGAKGYATLDNYKWDLEVCKFRVSGK